MSWAFCKHLARKRVRERWRDHVITRSPSRRARKRRDIPERSRDVSVNEGFLKVYSALRNVTRTLFLPFSLPPYPSLIFSVCPSFAPSASSALLVGLARSIQFTSSFFPTELESAPNKGRKRTSSSGRKELYSLPEGMSAREREDEVAEGEGNSAR